MWGKGKTLLALLITALLLGSCSPKSEKIAYGTDGCHFCTMTIVDKIHGAEIVTEKGKVFKFDAVECMINHLKGIDTMEVSLFLVNHYESPEALIDATAATYLISENLPSPMGAFLTAFEGQAEGKRVKAKEGGDLYTWNELLTKLNTKNVSDIP